MLGIAVGLIIIVLGWMMWKKEMIWMLHSYHYKNVKPEDRKMLCKWSGLGMMLTGFGCCLVSVGELAEGGMGPVPGEIVAGIGIVVAIASIIKYNGSLFG